MSEAIDYPALGNELVLEDDSPAIRRQRFQVIEGGLQDGISSDEQYIQSLVAEGEIVVSYMERHRLPSGRPKLFFPTYPL